MTDSLARTVVALRAALAAAARGIPAAEAEALAERLTPPDAADASAPVVLALADRIAEAHTTARGADQYEAIRAEARERRAATGPTALERLARQGY
jgi:hypothetical protein